MQVVYLKMKTYAANQPAATTWWYGDLAMSCSNHWGVGWVHFWSWIKKNLDISGRTTKFHATTMAFSASGTKRNETKKDTKRTCPPSPQKPKKLIRKKLINKLPRDVILMIAKMHPLLIPPFTNKTLRRAVQDYTVNGTGQPHETASGPSRPKTSPALCRAPQHRLPRSLAR